MIKESGSLITNALSTNESETGGALIMKNYVMAWQARKQQKERQGTRAWKPKLKKLYQTQISQKYFRFKGTA